MSRGIQEQLDRIGGACRAVGPMRLMEVCGTHTVALFRSGVKSLLPEALELISGPGCPVCVTAQGYIDAAGELAARPDVTICTYGDMVRVPGASGSLAERRARGGDVRVVYSAREAVRLARRQTGRQVVFLAVGFETTAPATAAAVLEARAASLMNFTILCDHKLVVPAMEALLADGQARIDGFLCPGHVSVVIGAEAYRPIAERHGRPCVVAGFEPAGMLEAIARLAEQIAAGEAKVDNAYGVAVRPAGNPAARACMEQVFQPARAVWRAMGTLDASGLALRPELAQFDAAARFGVDTTADYEPPGCRCGDVIQGKAQPTDCALFGTRCTPAEPVGPCMVSSEGTCAAWYKYRPLRSKS